MKRCLIVIPARLNSRRLPQKLLRKINSRPVLEWTWRAAVKANLGPVVIAADSKKIMSLCENMGAKAVLTGAHIKSGTDRVYEVAKKYPHDFILNLQGDEPFIKPGILRDTFRKFLLLGDFDIATAALATTQKKVINDPNCVKVAISRSGRAVYFSRHPVPYHHELPVKTSKFPYYKHIGFYFYTRNSLSKFVRLRQSHLEKLERLEQLRAIENGMNIFVNVVKYDAPSIDSSKDLTKARKYLKKRK